MSGHPGFRPGRMTATLVPHVATATATRQRQGAPVTLRNRGLLMSLTAVIGLALTACSGSAKPHPATAAQAAATASAKVLHLVDYATDDGTDSTVILTGAIGDFGVATTVDASGTPDPEHQGTLRLTLAHGGFALSIAEPHQKLVAAFARFPADPASCSGTVTVTGTAPIVRGSGSGAYQHISGSLSVTITVSEIDAKPKCDGTGAFLHQAVVITGTGTVTY